MIVAERKPFDEILEFIKNCKKILLAGCNECVTVCNAGGSKEVGILASALKMAFMKEGKDLEVKEITLERQCDPEYVEELAEFYDQYDAIIRINRFFLHLTRLSWGHPNGRVSGRSGVRDAANAYSV